MGEEPSRIAVGNHAGRRSLPTLAALAKRAHRPWPTLIGAPMSLSAVGIILVFLVVFGILNRIEFGRFD